nr:putative acetylesterase [uncultured bacterium]
MKTIEQLIIITFLLAVCINQKINGQNSRKKLSLSPLFTDHMVLQQKNMNPIWGKASAGAEIKLTASWGETVKTRANRNGKWQTKLKTPAYGGPHLIRIKSRDDQIELKKVLIGEVWLASGQSNMEWKMNQCSGCIDNQDEEILNANYPAIRMFNVPMDLTGKKLKNQKWEEANSKNVVDFSATAYFFARELHQKMGIPIGIINTSWGGTRIEAWISPKKLNEIDPQNHVKHQDSDTFIADRENYKSYNDSVALINEKNFGFKIIEFPFDKHEVKKKWHEYDFKDQKFIEVDFNDTQWNKINLNTDFEDNLFFENLYSKDQSILKDGIVWFRTKFDVKDPTAKHNLIFSIGIDDFDQTFVNGQNIGNTFLHLNERNYSIPIGLLKEKNNLMAVRVTDYMLGGGFRGPSYLLSDNDSIGLPFRDFKYKHHAIISNGYLMVHNYNEEDLQNKIVNSENKFLKPYNLNDPNEYSILYHNMLKPTIPFGIKGAIWYQGESNVGNYKDYTVLLDGMIRDWRSNWDLNFPFYFAQIAPYIYSTSEFSQGLRDAQRKVLNDTPKTGMAILLDIGEEYDIHPHNKQDVGKRLALLALNRDYGFDLVDSGPLYSNHEVKNDYIEVSFDKIGSGLISKQPLIGFEISGQDDIFYDAVVEIINDKLKVYSLEVKKPKDVRYGWKNYFEATLFNAEGLPASSFTTSD